MIAVIIPLYNKAPHISKAIESVLNQSVKPTKLIVVDDGSTDAGADIVEKYVSSDVLLIRQTNQGESGARNTGVGACKAPYIAFLDADDFWFPNHIEVLSNLVNRFKDSSMFSTSHLIQRDGRTFRARSGLHEGWSGEVDDFFIQYANGLSLINSSTACVRKEALLDVGGFPVGVRRGPDVMTWINIALKYGFAHSNTPTAVFNQEAVNRSNLHHETEPPGSLLMMQKMMVEGSVTENRRSSFGRLFDQIALMTAAGYRLKGDTQAAWSIAQLAYEADRYKTAAIISIVNFMPQMLLKWLRQRRHRTA
jgi:glycosyltransferase involved in cell wall biosynthesis